MKKPSYNQTLYACFIGYVVQAIVVNFTPLLFLRFQTTYQLSLDQIAFLTTANFGIQLFVDLLATKFVDRIGYRVSVIIAHVSAAVGLVGLAVFPACFADPYAGLMLAVVFFAIGGGIIEVLISPMVEACPGDRKEAAMSLLHSFYCWGHVGVVLISSLFFAVAGIENWPWLAGFWALVPLFNIFLFARVPIAPLVAEGDKRYGIGQLLRMRIFWVLILLMVAAGASEQAVSQWASVYAESVLRIPKVVGDLAGPLLFAAMMGASRLYYGKRSEGLRLERAMLAAGGLCLLSYLLISLTSIPALGFVGFALCGLAVGILWPGTLSLAAKHIRGGGTALFAFLALAGDLGCAGGPTFVGIVSKWFDYDLSKGILAAIIFPLLLLAGLFWQKKSTGLEKH